MLNNWEKKEKPIQGMMGFGGGATGYLVGGGGLGPFQLTGGTQSVIGDYTFHKFTNGMPGQFTVDSGETVDAVILIAAGGGGGGCQVGGGGGGGGLIHATSVPLKPGTYTYNVGAGGQGYSYPPARIGDIGNDSYITFPAGHPYGNVTRRAKGGGGGGGHNVGHATAGGSGGGGGGPPTNGATGTQPGESNPGWSQYGNPGGTGRVNNWFGGGGGGAGSAGGSAPTNHGGNGGAGKNFPQFPPAFGHGGYFCGGGGGCRDAYSGSNGAGGIGGGGQGGGDETQSPMGVMNGDAETGGGGGGRRDHADGAGDGGPGVIIIRYPNPV